MANFTAFDPGDGVVRLVVVGDFTRIGANSTNGRYLAAFRLDDPDPPLLDTTLFSTVDVGFDERVHAVTHEFDGPQPVLYLGGYFTSVDTAGGRRVRSHLARLRLTGGHFVLDEQWTPSLQSTQGRDLAREWVSRIVAVPGSDRVVIGGFWTTLNHRSANQEKYLAAVDKRTGAMAPWATPINKTAAGSLKWSKTKSTSQFPVFDMVLVDEGGTPVLYTGHGGTNLAAKWNAVTGERLWYWWSDGGVQAVTTLNGRVYFGFHGNWISPVAGDSRTGARPFAGTDCGRCRPTGACSPPSLRRSAVRPARPRGSSRSGRSSAAATSTPAVISPSSERRRSPSSPSSPSPENEAMLSPTRDSAPTWSTTGVGLRASGGRRRVGASVARRGAGRRGGRPGPRGGGRLPDEDDRDAGPVGELLVEEGRSRRRSR